MSRNKTMLTVDDPVLSALSVIHCGGDLPLFVFTSPPQPVTDCRNIRNKKKFGMPFKNVMYDPRVRRGSYVMDLGSTDDDSQYYYPCFEMVKKDPLCLLYNKKHQKCVTPQSVTVFSKPIRNKTIKRPSEVKAFTQGRQHSSCQTDVYYELLQTEAHRMVHSTQTETQNDLHFSLLGRARQRNARTGNDKDTQIYPGDLWDFDREVAPVVTDIGGVVIEQALLELMMENELEMLLNQQQAYEHKKALELNRLQRLQKRQQEIVNANAREIELEIENAEKAREAGKFPPMAIFAKNYLRTITAGGMEAARNDGVLKQDGIDAAKLVRWLSSKAEQSYFRGILSYAILDDIIQHSVSTPE